MHDRKTDGPRRADPHFTRRRKAIRVLAWTALSYFILISQAVGADGGTSRGHWDLSLVPGRTAFFGDLAATRTAPTIELKSRAWPVRSDGLDGDSYIEVSFLGTRAPAKGARFPFDAGTRLGFFLSDITAHGCYFQAQPAQVCFGVGFGELNVGGGRNAQTYGAPLFKGSIQHVFESHFLLDLDVQHFDVHQTVNDVNSSFSATTVGLGGGYRIN